MKTENRKWIWLCIVAAVCGGLAVTPLKAQEAGDDAEVHVSRSWVRKTFEVTLEGPFYEKGKRELLVIQGIPDEVELSFYDADTLEEYFRDENAISEIMGHFHGALKFFRSNRFSHGWLGEPIGIEGNHVTYILNFCLSEETGLANIIGASWGGAATKPADPWIAEWDGEELSFDFFTYSYIPRLYDEDFKRGRSYDDFYCGGDSSVIPEEYCNTEDGEWGWREFFDSCPVSLEDEGMQLCPCPEGPIPLLEQGRLRLERRQNAVGGNPGTTTRGTSALRTATGTKPETATTTTVSVLPARSSVGAGGVTAPRGER